jgi:uncharacterized protein with HEPN domain
MSKRELDLLIEDMLNSALKIKQYIGDKNYESFLKDEKTIDAVVRNFEIIGEASSRIPEEVKVNYPLIDWINVKGLRNIVIHEYFGIDFKVIWFVYENELDDLISQLQSLLKIYKL